MTITFVKGKPSNVKHTETFSNLPTLSTIHQHIEKLFPECAEEDYNLRAGTEVIDVDTWDAFARDKQKFTIAVRVYILELSCWLLHLLYPASQDFRLAADSSYAQYCMYKKGSLLSACFIVTMLDNSQQQQPTVDGSLARLLPHINSLLAHVNALLPWCNKQHFSTTNFQ